MNKKQKILIISTIIIVFAMGIIAPHYYSYRGYRQSSYGFIFNSPKIQNGSSMAIDTGRLGIQLIIVLMLFIGLFFLFKNDAYRQSNNSVEGVIKKQKLNYKFGGLKNFITKYRDSDSLIWRLLRAIFLIFCFIILYILCTLGPYWAIQKFHKGGQGFILLICGIAILWSSAILLVILLNRIYLSKSKAYGSLAIMFLLLVFSNLSAGLAAKQEMQQYLSSPNFSAEMNRLFDVYDYRLGDTASNYFFATNSDSLYSGSPIFRFLTDNMYKYEKRQLACDLPLLIFAIMYFIVKAKEKKSLKEIAAEAQKNKN